MRPKTIIILVAALAVLIAVAALAYNMTRPPVMSGDVNKPYFPDFDEKSVAEVFLEKPKDKVEKGEEETDRVELKVTESGWVVANRWNYPADEKQIENLMNALKELRRGEVRSTQAEQHKLFEVSADKALHLKVEDLSGTTKADLYVGKRAMGGKYFAREMGNDAVRVLNFRHFPANPRNWLKTRCFDADVVKADNVSEITVKRPGEVFRLVKAEIDEPDPKNASKTVKKTVWDAVEPEEFRTKEGMARSLASTIVGVALEDIVGLEAKPEHGLENASLVLNAVVDGYGNVSVAFGALRKKKRNGREEKAYYARISGIKGVVLIPEWRFKPFDKKLDDFREPKKEEPKKPEKPEEKPGPPKEEEGKRGRGEKRKGG